MKRVSYSRDVKWKCVQLKAAGLSTKDDDEQLEWRQQLTDHGYFVTDVKDRNYFNAIYFREPGEILFEITTDPPGFARDETYETMGEALKLPEQYEPYRSKIEEALIPIESTIKK